MPKYFEHIMPFYRFPISAKVWICFYTIQSRVSTTVYSLTTFSEFTPIQRLIQINGNNLYMNKIDIASTRLTDRKAIGDFELKVPVNVY